MTAGRSDEGFDRFYRTEYGPFVRLLVGMTGRWGIAEELAQEALISAHRAWPRLRELDRPDLWPRRVAVNRAISAHRRLAAEVAALGRLRAAPYVERAEAGGDDHLWAAVTAIAVWPDRDTVNVETNVTENGHPPDAAQPLVAGAYVVSRRHGSKVTEQIMAPMLAPFEPMSTALNQDESNRLRAEGEQMSWDQLVDEAIAEPESGDRRNRADAAGAAEHDQGHVRHR